MRSILEKGGGEKERRRNTLIIGTSLIVLMILSTAGYTFFSSEKSDEEDSAETVEYKGVEFKQTEHGSWKFEIGGYKFETGFNPEQTENVSVLTIKTLQDYTNQILYFGIDSKSDISGAGNQEILNNLNQFILRSNYACLTEDCEEDYPVKNCSEHNIVIFKENPAAKVSGEEGCVYIYAPESSEAERASDAFLFRIFGIR